LVPPTKEMIKIARQLRSATNSLRKRVKTDIARAKKQSDCKPLLKSAPDAQMNALLNNAQRKVNENILKSVLVCNSDCLTVSFADEVKSTRRELSRASKRAQKLAKQVVTCSGRVGGSDNPRAPRSEDALAKIINSTNRIVSECKVCPH
jgi:alanyl-tRNA synthetase